MRRRWIALGGMALLSATLFAGETRTWELSRQSDFLEGQDLKRIVVTSRGQLKVGHEFETVKLPKEASAWSGCLMPDGTVLAGTGRGKIYRIDAGKDATEVFDTGAGLVTSLVASGKQAFASTLPGGKIFRMDAAGQWSEFVKLEAENVWQLGAASDGTLYAAAGNPAKVFRIKPDGTTSLLQEFGADQALCLVVLAPEHLLIGTAQPAQIIELTGRKPFVMYEFGDGEVKSIVKRPDAIYAAVNNKSGALPHVVLKAVNPKPAEKKPADKKGDEKKKEDEFLIAFLSDAVSGTWEGEMEIKELEVKEKMRLKLALKDGKVTGTASSESAKEDIELSGTYDDAAKTLKLSATKEGVTLTLEMKLTAEDRLEGAVTLTMEAERKDGTISLRRIEKPAEADAPKPKGKEGEGGDAPKADPPKPAETPVPSAPSKSSIWRITDALTESMQDFPFYITQLAWGGDGVIAGTNFQGRVLKLFPDRTYEYFLDFKENNALGLLMKGNALHAVLLGDPGKVGFVSDQKAAKGIYVSQIFDAKFLSHWGKINVRSRGKIQVQTRTANVARNTDAFSDWSAPIAAFPADVASPKGRFLQIRITLAEPEAVVEAVSVAFKNENQRPRIQSFRIDYQPLMVPGEIPPQSPPQGPSPRLGMPHSPLKRVSWNAQDPDGDVLAYRLYYRPASGGAWVSILGGNVTPLNNYVWNTEAVPDGSYIVKVAASDERSNLKAEALIEEAESEPILVDNTKPDVKVTSAQGAKIVGSVTDATSGILRIEVQIDGGAWRTVMCKDGVLDSPREEFEIDLGVDKPAKGRHTVSVRAFDQEMNVGAAVATIDVP